MAFFASGRLIGTVATPPSIARSMLVFHHAALLRRSGGATRHTRSKAVPKHPLLEFWPAPNCAGSASAPRFTGEGDTDERREADFRSEADGARGRRSPEFHDRDGDRADAVRSGARQFRQAGAGVPCGGGSGRAGAGRPRYRERSEEHTSEI